MKARRHRRASLGLKEGSTGREREFSIKLGCYVIDLLILHPRAKVSGNVIGCNGFRGDSALAPLAEKRPAVPISRGFLP